MALYSASTGKILLTANATKTLALINPASPAITLRQIDISMDDATVASGVQFDLYRIATLGSPTGLAYTPQLADERDIAAQSTAIVATTVSGGISTEPSAVSVLASWLVQPLGGMYTLPFPYGAEVIGKGGGNRLGIRYVNPPGNSTDCIVNVWWTE